VVILFFPIVMAVFALVVMFYVMIFSLAAVVFAFWALLFASVWLIQTVANATGHQWDPNLAPFGPLAIKRATRRFRSDVLKQGRRAKDPERETARWQHSDGAVLVWTQKGRLMRQKPGQTTWTILGSYRKAKATRYAQLHDFAPVEAHTLTFTQNK